MEEEEEGPLTETDSDDEVGSSSGGSSSGDSLESYDLEESDEEGGCCLPALGRGVWVAKGAMRRATVSATEHRARRMPWESGKHGFDAC